MTDWNLNQVRLLSQWLTPIVPPDCQARIEARLKQGITGVYHERQRRHLCLLHALNNLLQGNAAFTQRELDGIADPLQSTLTTLLSSDPLFSLMPTAHRSGWGDYSTNVLHVALSTRNKTAEWYVDPEGREGLPPMASYGDKLVGILLNFQRGEGAQRHWVAMRMVGGRWYDLDSLLDKPCILRNGEEDLKREMASALYNRGRVVIVLENDVVRDVVNSSR